MAMTMEEMEREIKSLREQVAENRWAKDHLEVWKLMSIYSHYYYLGRYSEVPSLFAQKTPDVTMEIEDSGVYVGLESITRFWTEVFDVNRMARSPGWLGIHMTCNPVVEINKTGTKAKGIWHSHGFVSMIRDGEENQFLCLGKYIVHFIKEEGEWKIQHFNYRIAFMCPYEKGWIHQPIVASIAASPLNKPDEPIRYHRPYHKENINTFEPGPFDPYDD